MSSTGNLILAIMWIAALPLWFLGIAELIIGLIDAIKRRKAGSGRTAK